MFWFNLTHKRTHPRPYGHIYCQGVLSHRNVRKSRRFMKNHVHIDVSKHLRKYEKHPLDLLKSSIPDIFNKHVDHI